ncbi:MAG: hypothetical protein ACTSU5_01050 [Promethearchaeota archaeon]
MELWIVNKAGLPIFNWRPPVVPESINQNLFSGFLMAIINMVETSTQQEIEAIKFGNSKLNIRVAGDDPAKPDALILIGQTGIKAKDKAVRKTLDKIGRAFVDTYAGILHDWAGETSSFDGFVDQIEAHFVS